MFTNNSTNSHRCLCSLRWAAVAAFAAVALNWSTLCKAQVSISTMSIFSEAAGAAAAAAAANAGGSMMNGAEGLEQRRRRKPERRSRPEW